MGGSTALQLVRDTGLTGLVRRGSEHALDEIGSERLLPVLPELRPLLPGGGLRRGATIGIATHRRASGATREDGAGPGARASGASASVAVPGATSLLLALLAEAARAGSWCAVVGVPTLGVAAAAELGITLEHLALVPYPGPDWPTVVAALLDGFDIVVTAGSGAIAPTIASRLAARARQRGAVLMPYGSWPATDLTLEVTDPVWHGVDAGSGPQGEAARAGLGAAGRGRLRGRQLSVVARGRGAAASPRLTHLWLPRPTGVLSDPVEPATPAASEGAPLATVHPLRRTG